MSTNGFHDEKNPSYEGKRESATGEHVDINELKEHNIANSAILVDADLMVSAYDGENKERK
jgi:hypothetical protein